MEQLLIDNLAWLDNKSSDMLDLVIELCDQNSGTYNLAGLADVKKLLIREFATLGGELEVLDINPQEIVDDSGEVTQQPLGQAIHIVKRPEAPFRVMLCIHMDTVYGVDHSFQKCKMLDNGHLNGPGVADAKGGLVVMLFALRALEQSPIADQIGWEVLINPDEELGSPGSADLIAERASHCHVGLLFEPAYSDGAMVSWRKGVGNFSFVVRGRSAHSGREFEKGRNAIAACARMMDEIDQLNTDPEVTFNIGKISGGGPLNVVPDLCIGRINVRTRTREQSESVYQDLRSVVEKYDQLDGIQVTLHGKFTSPPKQLDERAERLRIRIDQCGQSLGISIPWQGSGGASDGNKFAAAGLPNIDTLGPVGGNIHSNNEFLVVSSLVPRAKLTALTLMSLAVEQL